MAEEALHLGVARSLLTLEEISRDTHENAVETSKQLHSLGIQKIFLVTSRLHLPRAVASFRKVGFEVVPIVAEPPDHRALSVERPSWYNAMQVEAVLNEYLGLFVYRLSGWI
jgi:uncharacterized SAM-binding protein YcdF (DUF218 family)